MGFTYLRRDVTFSNVVEVVEKIRFILQIFIGIIRIFIQLARPIEHRAFFLYELINY